MAQNNRMVEKREFFRLNFSSTMEFKSYQPDNPKTEGAVKNISQSGVLFQTKQDPPAISSILWMNLGAIRSQDFMP